MSIYDRNRITETVIQAKLQLVLYAGYLLLIICLIFLAWLFEFVLYEREIGEWMTRRWYVPIVIVILVSHVKGKFERNRRQRWESIVALSDSQSSDESPSSHQVAATGAIRLDNEIVGLVTAIASARGIQLRQKGKLCAEFAWNRFRRLTLRHDQKDGLVAIVELQYRSRPGTVELELPWSEDMNKKIPATLRLE